jgi:hypothetical protein
LCKATRRGRASEDVAVTLVEVFDLSSIDAAAALAILLVVYCPQLIPGG